MIPSLAADELKRSVFDLSAGQFGLLESRVLDSLLSFLGRSRGGMVNGPFLTLRLPHKQIDMDRRVPVEDFLTICPPYRPPTFQWEAFSRLCSHLPDRPRSTVIAGDAGGVTPGSFLYPVVDHCYRHVRKPGIKAIILCSTNAAARRLAKRLAQIIWNDRRLKDKVIAGLHLDKGGKQRTMGPDFLVNSREGLRKFRPAILITNFKMLDHLLLRPEDSRLWRDTGKASLRYLVLEDLHAYRGVRATGVACLLRRLKERLHIEPGSICCVATTVSGSLETSGIDVEKRRILEFCSRFFGERFSDESLIWATRMEIDEFLPDEPDIEDLPPTDERLYPDQDKSAVDYIERQVTLWFGWEGLSGRDLGDLVCRHRIFRLILEALGGRARAETEIVAAVARRMIPFRMLPERWRYAVLRSFLAMVGAAQRELIPVDIHASSPLTEPLVRLQSQLWVREVAGISRTLDPFPWFTWSAGGEQASAAPGLPPVYCKRCGHSGWMTFEKGGDDPILVVDCQMILSAYRARDPRMRYLFPLPLKPGQMIVKRTEESDPEVILGDNFLPLPQPLPPPPEVEVDPDTPTTHVCTLCIQMSDLDECEDCEYPTLHLRYAQGQQFEDDGLGAQAIDRRHCPGCDLPDSLVPLELPQALLLAFAAKTACWYPPTRKEKLLCISETAQAATHRACVLSAHSSRLNLQIAIATSVHGQPDKRIRLDRLTDRLLEVWAVELSPKAMAAKLSPPDLRDTAEYRALMGTAGGTASFGEKLRQRLSLEVMFEFGLNSSSGSSLELLGAVAVGPDPEQLDRAAQVLSEFMTSTLGEGLGDHILRSRQFLLGLLKRWRGIGAFHHPMLEPFAVNNGDRRLLDKRQNPLLPFFDMDAPRFLSADGRSWKFESLYNAEGYSWGADWARRALERELDAEQCNDLYRAVIRILEACKFVQRLTDDVLALRPEGFVVYAETGSLIGDDGTQPTTVPACEIDTWVGMPCMREQYKRRYIVREFPPETTSKKIALSGETIHCVPTEYTESVSVRGRERVEEIFGAGDRPDSPNLLACTYDLEVGIDPAAFSLVFLDSIPHPPSEFVFRTARAGLDSGSSLVVAIAGSDPSELQSFVRPVRELNGLVSGGRCSLDAPEVLGRHVTAYLMDCWARDDAKAMPTARNVSQLLTMFRSKAYPAPFLAFLKQKGELLGDRFLRHFAGVLSPDSHAMMRSRLSLADVETRLHRSLDERLDETASIRSMITRLIEARKQDSESEQPDEERKDHLSHEIRLLRNLVHQTGLKYPLDLFTGYGILPNYRSLFTTTLFATLYGIPKAGRGSKDTLSEVREYHPDTQDYLRELAPGEYFFAEERALVLNRVAISGKSGSLFESWVVCDSCSNWSRIREEEVPACPRCEGRTRVIALTLLPLKTIFTRAHYLPSRIPGHLAAPRPTRYRISEHVDFDTGRPFGALWNPEAGIEVSCFADVRLRRINLGQSFERGREQSSIPVGKFPVCHGCGVLRDARTPESSHRPWCPHVDDPRAARWVSVGVYGEIVTEAIRIILPPVFPNDSLDLESLRAGLELGLRMCGAPPNIRVLRQGLHDLTGAGGDCLVICDTVSRGTGYLPWFVKSPLSVSFAVEQGLEQMRRCSCTKTDALDGCQLCVYAHVREEFPRLSRRRAVDLLETLLPDVEDLAPQPRPESGADSAVAIEQAIDSFEAACRSIASRWEGEKIDGIRLCIGDNAWRFVTHPKIPSDLREDRELRPDAVFWPFSGTPEIRPIVIYLSSGPGTHPFEGIRRDEWLEFLHSSRYVLFTVDVRDLGSFRGEADGPTRGMWAGLNLRAELISAALGDPARNLPQQFLKWNAARALREYLYLPHFQIWQNSVTRIALASLFSPPHFVERAVLERAFEYIREAPVPVVPDLPQAHGVGALLRWEVQARSQLLLGLQEDGVHSRDATLVKGVLRLASVGSEDAESSEDFDGFSFAATANYLQFLSSFSCHLQHMTEVKRSTRRVAKAKIASEDSAPPAEEPDQA